MARVIERVDQLVLEYVSRVADAAHGVLRTDQRLDFIGRLRKRIEEDRRGSEDPATVRKVIARFGDPADLLAREVQRLAAVEQESARRSGGVSPAIGGRPRSTPRGGLSARASSRGGRASGTGPVSSSAPSAASGSAPASAPSPIPNPIPSPIPDSDPGDLGAGASREDVTRAPAADDYGESATEVFPTVVDDVRSVPSKPARPSPPRGVPPLPRGASPGSTGASLSLMARLRRIVMAGANPMATDGRDAGTILRNDRREVVGMVLLILAGLLVPFPLPNVAIFPIPVLVWAAGALTVLSCDEGWIFRDRLIGLAAPIVSYVVGGVVFGAIRIPEEAGEGVRAFLDSFWHVSGLMFMLGAGGGVFWLAYRLFNPPPPPPRRQPLGIVR